ncbi:hypothetical protein BGX38DRAFT_1177220 [Terfezia claveryi]|nr:hypothetical protein BGX38DRAFT_1177220 [Terfezia claveryi]
MSQFFPPPHQGYGNPSSQNLQFYPSTYSDGRVSGQTTPHQSAYGQYPGATGMMGHIHAGGGAMGSMGSMGSAPPGVRGPLTTGWLAAFGTSGYEDELPLMEELGVNFGHIKMKTLTVLNPLAAVDQNIMDDSDLAGPILFCLLFATSLLLAGKVHFGYIYGVALLGSLSLHLILNLMSHPGHGTNYLRSASVLGYCLLPLVITSFLGIFLSMDGTLGYGLVAAAILWCTYAASSMFVAVLRVRDVRWLVAYPLGLFYSVFGIMAIFGGKLASTKGSVRV